MRLIGTVALGLALSLASVARGDGPATASDSDAIVIPRAIPDPLEPVNRSIWSFNTVVSNRLLHPIGEGYRYIIREPVREKINNFARNLRYPQRLLNTALQGRWGDARLRSIQMPEDAASSSPSASPMWYRAPFSTTYRRAEPSSP